MRRLSRALVLPALLGALLLPVTPASAGDTSNVPDATFRVKDVRLNGYTGNIIVARARELHRHRHDDVVGAGTAGPVGCRLEGCALRRREASLEDRPGSGRWTVPSWCGLAHRRLRRLRAQGVSSHGSEPRHHRLKPSPVTLSPTGSRPAECPPGCHLGASSVKRCATLDAEK